MSSSMATLSTQYCWVVVVLLTIMLMLPSRALGGRHLILPAGQPASYVTPSPSASGAVVQVPPATRHVVILGRRRALRDANTQSQDVLQLGRSATRPASHHQLHRKILAVTGFKRSVKHLGAADSIYGHRLLVGSSPPTCQGKCGSCSPCNPIHVSIGSPHGALTQQEYYPEVWRCKCGNRLFMP